MRRNPIVSTYVTWEIRQRCFVGKGRLTGDDYSICTKMVRKRPYFFLFVVEYDQRVELDNGLEYEQLMGVADERELAIGELPKSNPWTPPGTSWPRYEIKIVPCNRVMPTLSSASRYFRYWCIQGRLRDPDRIFLIGGGASTQYPTRDEAFRDAAKYAREFSMHNPQNPNPARVLNESGECVGAYLAGELYELQGCLVSNPWTPPAQLWPQYQVRVHKRRNLWSADSYNTEWKVSVLDKQPDASASIKFDKITLSDRKNAFDYAMDRAGKLSLTEPRNPNFVPVIDENGRCFTRFRAGTSYNCP